jgi:hypothetical protein
MTNESKGSNISPSNALPPPLPPQPLDTDLEQAAIIKETLENSEKKFHQIINLEALEKNSIIVFKLVPESVDILISLPFLVEKMKNVLTEKNIAILVVNPEDDISTLSEKEMNRVGWERKEKSRIITLDKL